MEMQPDERLIHEESPNVIVHPYQLSGMYPMGLSSQDVRELIYRTGDVGASWPFDRWGRGPGRRHMSLPVPYVSTADARILVIATLATCVSS